MKSLFVFMFLLFTSYSYSQNIGYIHRDSVLYKTPNYLQNLRSIETLRNQYDSIIKAETNALQQRANKLFSKYPANKNEDFNALKAKLTPTELLELEELEKINKKIDNKKIANQKLIEIEQSKKIVPIIDKINKAITEYAEKNKIDIIYIIEDIKEKIAYINPNKNCTKGVLESILSKN